MISRKTARVIARAYQTEFLSVEKRHESATRRRYTWSTLRLERLYDFLFDHDYPAWLLNQAKSLSYTPLESFNSSKVHASRAILEWIMKLHTGETTRSVTPNWSWDQRRALGQRQLEQLAQDMIARLSGSERNADRVKTLTRSLELDGYSISEGLLLRPEADVLDVEEEHGVLRHLFDALNLSNSETTFHHLALSEEHYVAEKWDDSIANSRKFLESVLREVASSFGDKSSSPALSDRALESPFKVRDYLEREGLLEPKEKEAVAKVYGLLSHTGGHPYMAQSDQARLLRHLALTFSQFAMLRLKGFIASANQTAA